MEQERWSRREARAARRRERWERRGSYGDTSGMVFGLLICAAGVLFLLRNLNIIYFNSIWQFWPAIWIALGLSTLVSSRGCNRTGLLFVVLGSVFLVNNLGLLPPGSWNYLWPTALIGAGLWMLLRWHSGPGTPGVAEAGYYERADSSSTMERYIRAEVVFSGIRRKVETQELEGARVSAVFGGVDLDFRSANTRQDVVTIHADAVFGGIEIYIPPTWEMDMRGSGVFGSFENRTSNPYPSGSPGAPVSALSRPRIPKLIITGSAVFGGVVIRN